jgi:hypothetical protein
MDQKRGSEFRPTVKGSASAVIFLAFFGTLWAMVGINGLQGLDESVFFPIAILIGVGLVAGGIYLLRAAKRRIVPSASQVSQGRRATYKWFWIIFATELIAIVIAKVVVGMIQRPDLFVPLTLLIVGIHFFPMAALFRIKLYYWTGVLLCICVPLTLVAVPERLHFENLQITVWWVVLGFSAAIILWGSGFVQWFRGRKLLDEK